MSQIDLKGLDKAAVLAALFNASKPQGLGFMHYESSPMTVEMAAALLGQQTYFDYLQGRVMKVDLSGETLDPWGYDRDNGEGAAGKALATLRETDDANNTQIQDTHARNTIRAAQQVQSKLGVESKLEGNVMTLGLEDFRAVLAPKVKKAKEANRQGKSKKKK